MHPDPQRLAFKGRRLFYMEEGMFQWLMAAGAITYLLPPPSGPVTAAGLLDGLDGLVLSGGVDVSPASYGETPLKPEWAGDRARDVYETHLVQAALALEKPVLGICRGHQLLNVALGGTLFQDIRTQVPLSLHHRIFDIYEGNHHELQIEPGTALARLYGTTASRVNSVHHQAVKEVAAGLVVEARSPADGLVEAVRLVAKNDPYAVGVQWHPEFQDPGDKTLLDAAPLLADFLAAAERRRR